MIGAQRAQIVVLFALALPAMMGFLGLALDGGYYFAAGRAVQFASDAAAGAAAVDIQAGRGASATADGQTMARTNLTALRLTAVTPEIAYNNSATAAPTDAGWSTVGPLATTRAVRATTSATYSTLFLQLLKVPSVTIQRQAVVRLGAPIVALAVCSSVKALTPAGPWVVWDDKGSLCGVNSWDGLVDVDDSRKNCKDFEDWFLPQPNIPIPVVGAVMPLDLKRCKYIDNWLLTYMAAGGQPLLSIMVVDVANGRRLLGCVQVTTVPGGDLVLAIPILPGAAPQPCSGTVGRSY